MSWLGWVKLQRVLFQQKKMAKKGYCGNEGLGLAWDRMEMRQVAPSNTTTMTIGILKSSD